MLTLLLKQPIAQGYVYFEIILFFGGHKFIRVLGLILLFFVGFFLPVKFPYVTKTALDVPYPLSSCPVGLLSQRDLIFLFFWLYFICSNQSQDLCFVKIFQVCHLLINPVALECFFFFFVQHNFRKAGCFTHCPCKSEACLPQIVLLERNPFAGSKCSILKILGKFFSEFYKAFFFSFVAFILNHEFSLTHKMPSLRSPPRSDCGQLPFPGTVNALKASETSSHQ